MAVYTKLNQKKIEEILSNYNLGKLDQFNGIEEGIENTNYFLSVENKKFILTIYEKRVKSEDLPFFSDLMSALNKSNFKCPAPIINKKNKTITDFEGKKLIFVPFFFVLPIFFKGFNEFPSLNFISYSFPSLKIFNSNFSDNAFTTETPTPWRPPETL